MNTGGRAREQGPVMSPKEKQQPAQPGKRPAPAEASAEAAAKFAKAQKSSSPASASAAVPVGKAPSPTANNALPPVLAAPTIPDLDTGRLLGAWSVMRDVIPWVPRLCNKVCLDVCKARIFETKIFPELHV